MNKINNEDIIRNGFILTNHRSLCDFFIDPFLCQCPVISRRIAFFAVFLYGWLGWFYNRVIIINRNNKKDVE